MAACLQKAYPVSPQAPTAKDPISSGRVGLLEALGQESRREEAISKRESQGWYLQRGKKRLLFPPSILTPFPASRAPRRIEHPPCRCPRPSCVTRPSPVELTPAELPRFLLGEIRREGGTAAAAGVPAARPMGVHARLPAVLQSCASTLIRQQRRAPRAGSGRTESRRSVAWERGLPACPSKP